MDAATLVACRKSLEHWRENAKAETLNGVNTKASGCALCHMFVIATDTCYGCPIMRKTGSQLCGNSPWIHASRAYHEWADCTGPRDAFRAAATEMADFIEAIIKEAEQ